MPRVPVRAWPAGYSASIAAIASLFVLVVAVLLLLTAVSLEMLSAVRAFAGGEGLWSKGQKDAAYYLVRYAHTADERDYERHQAALVIPLADHQARLALEQSTPDITAATQGLLAGGNHPDDIPDMIFLYRTFRHAPYIADAIEIWSAADVELLRFQAIAQELRAARQAEPADLERVAVLLDELDQINTRLTALENEFSYTMGAGARAATQAAFALTVLGGLALCLLGGLPAAQMLRRLSESEQRYRELVRQSADALIVHDIRGHILDVNAQLCALLGYTRAELLARSVDTLVLGLDINEAERRWKLADPHFTRTIERQLCHKDGTLIAAEVRLGQVRLDGVTVIQAAIRDLTERRKAEAERLALQAQLLEAQKLESLGVLAGGIAHDFNNLLTVMLGNLELAMLDLSPDTPVWGAVQATQRAAQQASDLTHQMLIYAGRGSTTTQPIDLNALIREMTSLLTSSAGKHVRLHHELTDGLPTVLGDATQLRQVVMNLITNAADAIATTPGSITIRTELATHSLPPSPLAQMELSPGEYVCISVCDTGQGMDETTQRRMFDPFFTTKQKGRGLGLAAVQGIIRQHQGSIVVQSNPGAGTTVTVWLPAAPTVITQAHPVISDAAPEHAAEAGPASGPLLGEVILVVDDEASVRAVAAQLLERMGARTLAASDGPQGIALLQASTTAVTGVLLDVTMPGMSGLEVARHIQTCFAHIPIVLMSGFTEEDLRAQGSLPAVGGFLHKPFTRSALLAALRRS